MHMHMTMRWRADAAMERIDIADKVTGLEPLVNAIPPLRQSISTMRLAVDLSFRGAPGDEESAGAVAYFSSGRRSVTASCCG